MRLIVLRQTRYAKFNIACPRVNRNTEGGRTFTVTASLEWNKLPLQMRKAETLNDFQKFSLEQDF